MRWLCYHLYGNISDEPKQLFHYTATGSRNLQTIERQVAAFRRQHRDRIRGLFIFRFWTDPSAGVAAEDHAQVPEHHYGENVRLRFRVADGDEAWAMRTFLDTVITPLQQPATADNSPATEALAGWRRYDGYDARGDVGARYGDLSRGIDPTEEVVSILSAWTDLRFFLLDHPDLQLNSDLINLFFNTIGLTYPEEVDVLEAQQSSLRRIMSHTIGL